MARFLLGLLLVGFGLFGVRANADEKLTLGWVERVLLMPGDLPVYARMNPGSERSSLYVAELEESERGGHQWVKFVVHSRFGQKSTIEKEVSKIVLVKGKSGELERRAKVMLSFCVGTRILEGEVMLVKREQFSQHVEFGRILLAKHALVDPSLAYTLEPSCKGTRH